MLALPLSPARLHAGRVLHDGAKCAALSGRGLPHAARHGQRVLARDLQDRDTGRTRLHCAQQLRISHTALAEHEIFLVEGRISFIDCEDIAACALKLLLDDGHAGKTYTLTGPAAISYKEIAGTLSTALGKPVEYVDLPPERMLANLQASGMPAAFADMMLNLMLDFARGGGAVLTPAVSELLGRPARSFEQFVADNVAAFR